MNTMPAHCSRIAAYGLIVLGVSCAGEDQVNPDTVAPAAVRDLVAVGVSDSTVILAWTVPGDDGRQGRASSYDIRYSVDRDSLEAWPDISSVVISVTSTLVPGCSGCMDSLEVDMLIPEVEYYFALKVADEAHNISALSNIEQKTTTANQPPVACFTVAPQSGSLETAFSFDSHCTSDPDDAPAWLTHRIDWQSDGIIDVETRGPWNGTHTYPSLGLHAALLVVIDPLGAADSARITVEVTAFQPRNEPQNLLRNLELAYNERKLVEVESLLAEDYVFVPHEIGHGDLNPFSNWGRSEELAIHSVMFDSDHTFRLSLSYDFGTPDFDPGEGLSSIIVSDVDISLIEMTPSMLERNPRSFTVPGHRAQFWFRKNPWIQQGTEDSVWTIVKCQDLGGPLAKGRLPMPPEQEVTWSELKDTCRQP